MISKLRRLAVFVVALALAPFVIGPALAADPVLEAARDYAYGHDDPVRDTTAVDTTAGGTAVCTTALTSRGLVWLRVDRRETDFVYCVFGGTPTNTEAGDADCELTAREMCIARYRASDSTTTRTVKCQASSGTVQVHCTQWPALAD